MNFYITPDKTNTKNVQSEDNIMHRGLSRPSHKCNFAQN